MKYKLGDIVTVLGDGLHGTPKYDDNGEYYFLNGNNIENGKLVIKPDTKRVNHEEYLKYRKELNDRTILVSINGTLGKVGTYNNEKCILGKSACYFNIKESVNKEYIKFLLTGKNFQDYIENYATGTTIKNMSLKAMKDFEFELPDRDIQDKVAYILNSITSKIEANTHTNNNLYKIFRNIYRDTFHNKNSSYIKFSDFNEAGTLIMGQSPKGSSYNEEKKGIPLINGAADYKDGMLNSNKYTSEPTRICNAKDLVFCIRATIGQLTIADQEYCLGRGVACISNINETYYEYVYNIIEDSIDKLKQVATGSVILGLSKDDINNLEVYQPTLEEIEKFHIIEEPILKRMLQIKEQNKKLEKIRDTLLPKLMNGEIDLDKIEI